MTKKINYWQATKSGFRSSTTLLIGAFLGAISGLLQFVQPLVTLAAPFGSDNLIPGIWTLWILSLWMIGLGFIFLGSQPFMTRFGFLVGAIHIIQGIFLLVVLFAQTGAMVPPLLFSVARLLSIFLFAIVDRESLGEGLSIFLWVAALLQLLKIALRVLETLPAMAPLVQSGLDTAFLWLVCAALVWLARHLHRQEDAWAQKKYQTKNAGFADFNNPEHQWND